MDSTAGVFSNQEEIENEKDDKDDSREKKSSSDSVSFPIFSVK